MKLVPVIVSWVPPRVVPDCGIIEVIVDTLYVKLAGRVTTWFPGLVTVTSTTPAACGPVRPIICVALLTVTDVAAAPPRETVAPVAKFVPVIVTESPPKIDPMVGRIAVIEGGGPRYTNPFVSVAA